MSEAFRGPFEWRAVDELSENEPCLGTTITRHKYFPSEINPVNVLFSKYGHHQYKYKALSFISFEKNEKFSNPTSVWKTHSYSYFPLIGLQIFLLFVLGHSLNYKPDGSRNFLYLALHTNGDLHITALYAYYILCIKCYTTAEKGDLSI